MRESDLLDTLQRHLDAQGPLCILREVTIDARRIDALVLNRGRRLALEVKVTRAAYARETDAKRAPTERVAHECAYVAPPGLIDPSALPRSWGLWEVTASGVEVVVAPPSLTPDPTAAERLADGLLARAAAYERRQRDPADPARLAAENDRLLGLVANRDEALARERHRAQDAAEQVQASLGAQTCDSCGEQVHYTRVSAWKHLNAPAEAACETSRLAAERSRLRAATGAEYVGLKAPRVLPRGVSTDR